MQEQEIIAAETAKKPKGKGWKRELLSWLVSFAVALVAVLLIRAFLFTVFTVSGNSMLETFHDGDRVYVSVLTSRLQGYERGDVVICYYDGADHACIKRVMGLPGDTLEIVNGTIYANGEAVENEDYVTYASSGSMAPITLGEGEYFVMGDNRPISHDSRAADVGVVTNILGEVRFRFWPLNRIGGIH